MKGFEQCPVCGGELEEKEVEKLLRGGENTAVLHVPAQVCLRCGERLYSIESAERFEEVRERLARSELAGFEPVGRFFKVGLA